jgi:glycerophosphoryl diester phosphodiesterase
MKKSLLMDLHETQDRIEQMDKAKKDQLTVDMYLVNFQDSLIELKKRGVDMTIVSDTMINALNYGDISRLCSNFDSFLRSKPL